MSGLFQLSESGRPQIGLDARSVYTFGLLIRRTEELLLRLFSEGLVSGTTHTCIGQEICAMSVVRALSRDSDFVFSNHRNHGHFLTYSGEFAGLVAEIMGREAGVCGGVGGSQHLAYRGFHSNGVQGGMTAIGVGHALAIERKNQDGVVAVIVGDGTLGEGLLYESMNLAGVWKLPILFVVENNGIAQTTETRNTLSGTIDSRGKAFGLDVWQLDDSQPDFLERTEQIVGDVRGRRRPGMLVVNCRRLGPHSKGDDLRSDATMAEIRERDPLAAYGRLLTADVRAEIDATAEEYVRRVRAQVETSREASGGNAGRHFASAAIPAVPVPAEPETFRGSINRSLAAMLEEHPEVIVLGEDLHDPYGGAFKVTVGLSQRFEGRVISTPISEAGIVGTGIGLAMSGFRPIVEIMFADFVTLGMDQIYNHAVKFPAMFPDTRVPLVVRTAGGGRRGYGPTHSQSPEHLMAAVPGLTVLCPSHRHNPGTLLARAVLGWNSPVVFFEHKLLYGQALDRTLYRDLEGEKEDPGGDWFPTLVSGPGNPDVTFVAYGYSTLLAEAAAEQLATEELKCEIVIPCQLAPFPRRTLGRLLANRKRIVVIEEAPAEFGFSAELAVALLEVGFQGTYKRVAPPPLPIPAARSLEAAILPTERDVIEAAIDSVLADFR